MTKMVLLRGLYSTCRPTSSSDLFSHSSGTFHLPHLFWWSSFTCFSFSPQHSFRVNSNVHVVSALALTLPLCCHLTGVTLRLKAPPRILSPLHAPPHSIAWSSCTCTVSTHDIVYHTTHPPTTSSSCFFSSEPVLASFGSVCIFLADPHLVFGLFLMASDSFAAITNYKYVHVRLWVLWSPVQPHHWLRLFPVTCLRFSRDLFEDGFVKIPCRAPFRWEKFVHTTRDTSHWNRLLPS